jgi:hypothetical protein
METDIGKRLERVEEILGLGAVDRARDQVSELHEAIRETFDSPTSPDTSCIVCRHIVPDGSKAFACGLLNVGIGVPETFSCGVWKKREAT